MQAVHGRERQVPDFQHAVDADVAEQEAAEILETFLRIHDAERAAVAAMNVGARRTRHVGILDAHQPVAQFAGEQAGGAERHIVVLAVGADQAEEPTRVEFPVKRVDPGIPVLDVEILAHDVAVEVVHVPQAEETRNIHPGHLDAIVRRGEREDLVDQPACRVAAGRAILEKAAADQSAHRMRHQIHPEILGFHLAVEADLVAHAQDEVAQSLRGIDDRGHLAGPEIRIGHIVVAMDDDALSRDRSGFDLQAIPIDVAVALFQQSHDERLEEHLAYRAVPGLACLGRTGFEPHVGGRGGFSDFRLRHRVTANVEDGITRGIGHVLTPDTRDVESILVRR